MALSKKKRAFVEYYLASPDVEKRWNATQAAIQAGYSEKTARQQGSRLLTNVDIQEAIEERLLELKMGADEVLTRLAEQGRGDMGQFIGLTESQLKEHPQSHLIKKYEKHIIITKKGDEHIRVKIELYDGQTALLNIGKQHGLFAQGHKHEGKIDIDVDAKESLIEKLERLAQQVAATDDATD
jgi:phage terminase small subunit